MSIKSSVILVTFIGPVAEMTLILRFPIAENFAMFIQHVRFLKASSTFPNASNSGETDFGEHNYTTFLFTLT